MSSKTNFTIADVGRLSIYIPHKKEANSVIYIESGSSITSKTYIKHIQDITYILSYSPQFRKFANNTIELISNKTTKQALNKIEINVETMLILFIFLQYYRFFTWRTSDGRKISNDFDKINLMLEHSNSKDLYKKIKSIEVSEKDREFEHKLEQNILKMVDIIFKTSSYEELIGGVENNLKDLYHILDISYSKIPITKSDKFKQHLKHLGETGEKLKSGKTVDTCIHSIKRLGEQNAKNLISSIVKDILSPLPAKELFKETKNKLKEIGFFKLSELEQHNLLRMFSDENKIKYLSYIDIYEAYHEKLQ